MDAPPAPFASASLAALRLLVGFALTAEEAAPGRPALLAHAGATGARPCQAPVAVLCALRECDVVRGVLDGILAATLGREAERYAPLSAPALARCWHERRDGLSGRELAALLWQVARRGEQAFRELETDIACSCKPLRLLSQEQRTIQGDLDAA
jgi:hypothetical protein